MSKLPIIICLVGVGYIPIFMDVSNTHLFNEFWDAHARAHLAWMLAGNFFLATLGIYLCFFKNLKVIPSLISLGLLSGYIVSLVSMPIYDGVAIGEGGDTAAPFGIPINIPFFGALWLAQLIAFYSLKNKNIQS